MQGCMHISSIVSVCTTRIGVCSLSDSAAYVWLHCLFHEHIVHIFGIRIAIRINPRLDTDTQFWAIGLCTPKYSLTFNGGLTYMFLLFLLLLLRCCGLYLLLWNYWLFNVGLLLGRRSNFFLLARVHFSCCCCCIAFHTETTCGALNTFLCIFMYFYY